MDYENSERFLNAFSEIEEALEQIIDADRHFTFYQLVDKAGMVDKAVKSVAIELKEYADLRNAIVHERIDGQPIAEPHIKTVERIEKIRDIILEPPRVKDGFLGEVIVCSPDDAIGKAMSHILEKSFSQIPVYEAQNFVGLLTTETVARWLADKLSSGKGFIEEETVKAVMKYSPNKENYAFIDIQSTMFDVLGLFEEFNQKGKILNAVLITQSGEKSGKPVGIITVFDLPQLYETIDT